MEVGFGRGAAPCLDGIYVYCAGYDNTQDFRLYYVLYVLCIVFLYYVLYYGDVLL